VAQRASAIECEDVPLDEARRMSRGPRMDPAIDSAFKQNIPSLDNTVTRMPLPEGTSPTTTKNRILHVAEELNTIVTVRRVPGGLIFWRSTDEDLQQAKVVILHLFTGYLPLAAGSAARDVQPLTDRPDGIISDEAHHHSSPLRKGPFSKLEVFFVSSNSRVRRPTIRHRAVICAPMLSCCSSPWNTLGTLSRNSPADQATLWGLIGYSRRSSARLLSPLIRPMTTCPSNFGVNRRRVPIATSSSWTILNRSTKDWHSEVLL
jgi:hypothetical protein